jgi:hypothetical protein
MGRSRFSVWKVFRKTAEAFPFNDVADLLDRGGVGTRAVLGSPCVLRSTILKGGAQATAKTN